MLTRAPLSLLYLNVLVVATCGLVYELLAGTLASYVLGDSVTQFSFVIGVYLSAMGVGAWLSVTFMNIWRGSLLKSSWRWRCWAESLRLRCSWRSPSSIGLPRCCWV